MVKGASTNGTHKSVLHSARTRLTLPDEGTNSRKRKDTGPELPSSLFSSTDDMDFSRRARFCSISVQRPEYVEELTRVKNEAH